jgi:phage baseplate assembly protein W
MSNLGLTLPIQRGNNGYFAQGRDVLTQVKSNLTNLILTRKGERLLQPEFGCDVYQIIFEPLTDDNVVEIRSSIESAVKLWLPYIRIDDVDVQQNEDRNTIFATLTFSIKSGAVITDSITLVF